MLVGLVMRVQSRERYAVATLVLWNCLESVFCVSRGLECHEVGTMLSCCPNMPCPNSFAVLDKIVLRMLK